jgi:DNA-directed RNA polymerase specialized sigma24 family protein
VGDQFRKRPKAPQPPGAARVHKAPAPPSDDTARTPTVERVPDPHPPDLEAIWDSEWRENLLRAALDRVKRTVNPAHYEMFHLHVVQGLSPRDTARALDVTTAAVHLAKHRVGRLVKAELKRLEAARG